MGRIGAIWGFGGVFTLLGFAIYRLGARALEIAGVSLSPAQWIFLVVFALFMLVAEGYRGFQKKFSPRTAARVRYLYDHPRPSHVALAPFFCMGYFHATRRTRIASISLTVGIVLLVLLVRLLPNPWRGIVDFGVVLGLSYGLVSFIAFTILAFSQRGLRHSPEVPAET